MEIILGFFFAFVALIVIVTRAAVNSDWGRPKSPGMKKLGQGLDKIVEVGGKLFDEVEKVKDPWTATDPPAAPAPKTPAAPPTFQTEDHDHIPSTALNQERRLEQLEWMKEAGLLDDDEYKKKKREIKRGE